MIEKKISNNNLNKEKDLSFDDLVKALGKLDNILEKGGLDNYQERMHRIAKKIKSIEAHADCFVSEFSLDEIPQFSLEKYYDDNKKNYQSEYMSMDTKKGKIEFQNSSHKNDFCFDMKDLLFFMENELEIKSAIEIEKNKKESTNYESSDSEDEDKKINDTATKKKSIKDKFFDIEIKLRAFIKQQQHNNILKEENFDSFMNQIRLKTPMTKKPPKNPSFVKNFFAESKQAMENITKKRMTMNMGGAEFKNMLKNKCNIKDKENDEIFRNIDKNRSEKNKNFIDEAENDQRTSNFELVGVPDYNNRVSNFNIDSEDNVVKVEEKFAAKVIRNSIFKSPYAYDKSGKYVDDEFEPIQELLTKDDVESNSDESSSTYSDDEVDENDDNDKILR
jgi:uncharacterized short protein YbdD (DUF466 family)